MENSKVYVSKTIFERIENYSKIIIPKRDNSINAKKTRFVSPSDEIIDVDVKSVRYMLFKWLSDEEALLFGFADRDDVIKFAISQGFNNFGDNTEVTIIEFK